MHSTVLFLNSVMRAFVYLILLFSIFTGCKPKALDTSQNHNAIKGDTITIANKDLDYEVTIIDPGFSSWLYSRALPRGYYSESFLEDKNRWYVQEWNTRVRQPQRYSNKLYEMEINYNNTTHYGYEVNYLIYNYMIYFQNTYNQRLFGIVPPR